MINILDARMLLQGQMTTSVLFSSDDFKIMWHMYVLNVSFMTVMLLKSINPVSQIDKKKK